MPGDFMTPELESAQEDSVFIRYSSGFVLKIEPNLKSSVGSVVEDLRVSPDYRSVLQGYIRRTSYGGGYGEVAKESTWIAATLELFERFRRYASEEILAEEVREVLVDLVVILTDAGGGVDWDRTRQFIVDHIDILCPLSRLTTELDGQAVLRDTSGYYSIDEDGQRVDIHGLQTPPEQALQFYTNDIQERYGRLYYLLRYVALFEIAYQYQTSPSDFPENLSCTLYDNNGGTHYLGWEWKRPVPFEYVAYKWYPRSPFSNPDWLGSDLIMHLNLPDSSSEQPQLSFQPTDEASEKWNEVFGAAAWQLELPISTNLLIGNEAEVYFEFLGKKVRWINGSVFLEPILVIPADNEDAEEAIELARKFLSLLNYKHTVELSERWISIQPKRYIPLVKQPRMTTFYLVQPEYALINGYEQFSQQKWYALAFMREAENARSIFYSFLNYYKIIEMVHGSAIWRWIDENIEAFCSQKGLDWYDKNIAPFPGKKASVQLGGTMRNAIAHGVYRSGGNVTHNPDDPKDYNATLRDLPVIKILAGEATDSL